MQTLHGAVPQLQDYLSYATHAIPHKVAVTCGPRSITFAELDEQSTALARTLSARGVVRGDRVLVLADNGIECIVAFWAALKANAVACVLSPQVRAEKLAYIVGDCRPSALVASAHLENVWSRVVDAPSLALTVVIGGSETSARMLSWDDALALGAGGEPPSRRCLDIDLASIIYTSGSTGEPKGVMLSHRNMLTAATSVSSYLGLRGDDVILNALPLSFDYGLYQMIMGVRVGARLVLEPSFAFPVQIVKAMERERVTVFPGVPTMFATLSELQSAREHDFSSVRIVTNTAAALPLKHIRVLRELFPKAQIFSMYGLTECKRCTYLPPEDLDRKPTSVGIPIPNTELWVVDADGNRLPPYHVGQLVIRGATVMQGYWEKPEETAKRLKPGPLPGERVLWTGDYCMMDEEGYVYFVARMDDIIKSRGEKVPPKEVEAALVDISGVKEAAVIGVPDPILGQAVKAFVVLERSARLSERELKRKCQERLESYMVPKYIEFVSELPRTDSGKVRRASLTPMMGG